MATPQDYVGKFVLIRQPMLPKSLQFVDPCGYRVTGTRGKLQVTIEPVDAETRHRRFTRISGEHIAYVFLAEADLREGQQRLREYLGRLQEIEQDAMEQMFEINFKDWKH